MEKLDYLINYLIKENENVNIDEIPTDKESKKRLYRSLCNIRDPKPIEEKYREWISTRSIAKQRDYEKWMDSLKTQDENETEFIRPLFMY